MKTFLHIEACPIRDIISRLGDKWSLLVLATLNVNGTMRFNDIHKSIGDISQRMLTVTLRSLEADGLVVRKIYAEVPPRVEYKLTESGSELMPYLNNLVEWAVKNMENIENNRKKYEKIKA
ncbi:helix-turn-helix domain-containing protein [Prevotella sp. 10(H)]|uniref:winged helix-turn-helix transcriptional regulator n=1 Tax=Prevotella sp. 10(H) TaxID=1158294 RepID=UPI0004A6F478|nr:helix-turn-helix domain-containing protein [Prevotella sp. 10(H)]